MKFTGSYKKEFTPGKKKIKTTDNVQLKIWVGVNRWTLSFDFPGWGSKDKCPNYVIYSLDFLTILQEH